MAIGQKPILSARVSQDLLDRLEKLAELAEVGRAAIVERCLELGLMESEEFVDWLKAPIKGPLVRLLTLPILAPLIAKCFSDMEVDATSMAIRRGALRKSAKGRAGLAPNLAV
jgi:hypothetical protein